MAHKSERQFFGTDVRGIRLGSQDDAKEGYNFDGREFWNFGKEFYNLSFVRAKTSLARVQLTPLTQVDDGRYRGPPPSGVLLPKFE